MSDEKLRELERRFRETGSADDELAWLRECARSGEKLDWDSYSRLHELDVEAAADLLRWRVKTGDLSQERLEVAAWCGHEASGRIARLEPIEAARALARRVAEGLGEEGRLQVAAAAISCCKRGKRHIGPDLEAFLATPSAENRATLQETASFFGAGDIFRPRGYLRIVESGLSGAGETALLVALRRRLLPWALE
ncbi:MAG TPA: hypothetical protein DEA08_14500 [Planctomycetes bacterium]|nr:hypothetical protein [Planctomycetota bacterium]